MLRMSMHGVPMFTERDFCRGRHGQESKKGKDREGSHQEGGKEDLKEKEVVASTTQKVPPPGRNPVHEQALSFASAEALFRILAPTLEGDVEHRHQKDADRGCSKHAAEHRRADGPSTDLGRASRDHCSPCHMPTGLSNEAAQHLLLAHRVDAEG
jgi:hypothetical protein